MTNLPQNAQLGSAGRRWNFQALEICEEQVGGWAFSTKNSRTALLEKRETSQLAISSPSEPQVRQKLAERLVCSKEPHSLGQPGPRSR
jgi:hypothetical protein